MSSIAVHDLMVARNCDVYELPDFSSAWASQTMTTSCAVTGVPSWKVAFGVEIEGVGLAVLGDLEVVSQTGNEEVTVHAESCGVLSRIREESPNERLEHQTVDVLGREVIGEKRS